MTPFHENDQAKPTVCVRLAVPPVRYRVTGVTYAKCVRLN